MYRFVSSNYWGIFTVRHLLKIWRKSSKKNNCRVGNLSIINKTKRALLFELECIPIFYLRFYRFISDLEREISNVVEPTKLSILTDAAGYHSRNCSITLIFLDEVAISLKRNLSNYHYTHRRWLGVLLVFNNLLHQFYSFQFPSTYLSSDQNRYCFIILQTWITWTDKLEVLDNGKVLSVSTLTQHSALLSYWL